MINWQLSKQDIRWPVSPDRTAGSSVDPSRSSTFLKFNQSTLFRWQITSSNWSQAEVSFFPMIHMKSVVFMSLWPRTVKILISNWPWTQKFSHSFFKYRRGRPFLTMVTRWSRSTSNFCTLIGQNLTGEFMRKIYAASWKLFTLTAEADRVLCRLVINCLFPLDVQNEIQLLSRVFCYPWLVCLLGFWLRNASLVKIG